MGAETLIGVLVSLAVSAGSSVAQRLFTPKPKTVQRGKYEGDLFVQNSAYGQNIPRIYGANPTDNKGGGLVIAGNVIWTSGIRKKTEKTSGGKGPRRPATEDITYDVDLAVMLGLGPLKVTKIWANTTLIYNEDTSEASTGPSGVYDPDAAPDTDYNQFLPPNPNGTYSIDRYDQVTTPDGTGTINLTTNSGNFASIAIYPGNDTQLVDPLIQADVDGKKGTGSTPAYRGRCYVVFEKFNLTKFGNAVPNFTFQVEHKTVKTLDEICAELCGTVGLASADFNFTALENIEVRGFVQATRSSPKSMLEILARVYNCDFYEADGVVRGTLLTADPVAMISEDDLGVQEGGPQTESNEPPPLIDSTLIDEPQLSRQIEVKFFDPRRDGQSNTQRETRQAVRSEKTETLDVPCTLIPREARLLAQRELYQAWLERNQFALPLGWKYAWLKPTDSITVEIGGFTYFVRIKEVRGTAPAPLQFVGVAQEVSVFDPAGQGDGGDGYEPFPVNTPPQSIATLFNLPNLRAGDPELGYYAACAARGPGNWEGAALFKDMGLGFEKIAEWSNQATMGVAVGALGNFTGTGTDTTNTVTVDLYFGSLASASGGDLDAGANLAILGNEVIQWETASQVSGFPRRFTLSNLRRGQKGTSDQIGSHIAGERFSLIDTAVIFVATLASEAGIERTYKAVTVGQNVDDAASFTYTWTGNPNANGNTDTDIPNIAKITEAKIIDRKRLPDDKVQSVLSVRIPNRLTDLEANAASIDAAEITVYDRFLTLILAARLYPFQGDGVAATISHVRKYADPIGFKDVAETPYNSPEAIYKFRLRNKFGFSQPFWVIGETFRTTQPPATDPGSYVIRNLKAVPSSASTVDLTWEYSGTSGVSVTWYIVPNDRQATATAAGTLTAAGATSYQVTGLLPNTTYDFRVNPAGDESFSNITSAKTFEGLGNVVIQQTAPSGLAAAQLNSTSNVRLTWTANTTENTGVEIWRKTGSGGTYAMIATAGKVVEYIDGSTATSTLYYYKVKNVYAAGVSDFSNEVSITTAAFYPAPVTSTQSGKGDVSGSTKARFCWYPTGTGQTGFEIYRNGSLVGTVPGTQFYYNDSGLSASTSYNHQVRAKYGTAFSDYSAQTTANTTESSGSRLAPTNLVAVAVSATQIDITWTRNATDNTSTNCILVYRDGFVDTGLSSGSATSYSITGLTADTEYTILLVHYFSGGKTSPYVATTCRTLTTGGTGGGYAAPTGLSATAASTSQINLAWTDSTTGGPLRTEIWRGTSTSSMSLLVTVNVGTTTYSDTGLSASTQYFYKIRHLYPNAQISDFTATVNATTNSETYPAPSGLTATAASTSQIDLSWTRNTTSNTGVQVFRNGALLTTLGAAVTTFSDTGLSSNTTYTYQVRNSFSGGNLSNYSNTAQATTQGGVQFPAPLNLSAIAQSEFSVALSWTRNTTSNTSASIYRNGVFLATVGATTTTYTDNACNPATTYTYKVYNSYSGGDSGFSNEATVTTPSNSAFPAPTSLSVSAASDTALNLSWTRNSTTNTGVEVWEALSPTSSTYFLIATLGAAVTTYQRTGLQPGTTYKYQVRNVYSGGNYSAFSSSANGTTNSTGTYSAPTGLSATTAPGQVQLNWTRNSTTNTGVEVYRQQSGGFGRTLLATLGATTTTYTDTTGVVGTVYYYSVRNVYSGPNYSAEISTAGVDFPSNLPAPSNLTIPSFSGSIVNLAWTRNTTSNTETRLARTGIAGELILDPTRTTYDDYSVLPGNTYIYKLRHYYGNGQFSAYSNEATVTTPAGAYPAPTALVAQATGPTSIVLDWQFPYTSNNGFEIYRNGLYYATVGASTYSYTDTSVTANTSYTYKVRATFTGPNFSSFSNEVTVTTPTDQYPPPLNLQYNQITSDSVHLFWIRNSSTNTQTQIYQDGVSIGNVGAATTDFTVTGLSPNTDYVFKVRHRYGGGIQSIFTNEVFVTTLTLVLL